jgi:hypothetical protein
MRLHLGERCEIKTKMNRSKIVSRRIVSCYTFSTCARSCENLPPTIEAEHVESHEKEAIQKR